MVTAPLLLADLLTQSWQAALGLKGSKGKDIIHTCALTAAVVPTANDVLNLQPHMQGMERVGEQLQRRLWTAKPSLLK